MASEKRQEVYPHQEMLTYSNMPTYEGLIEDSQRCSYSGGIVLTVLAVRGNGDSTCRQTDVDRRRRHPGRFPPIGGEIETSHQELQLQTGVGSQLSRQAPPTPPKWLRLISSDCWSFLNYQEEKREVERRRGRLNEERMNEKRDVLDRSRLQEQPFQARFDIKYQYLVPARMQGRRLLWYSLGNRSSSSSSSSSVGVLSPRVTTLHSGIVWNHPWAVPPADKPGGSGGVVLNELSLTVCVCGSCATPHPSPPPPLTQPQGCQGDKAEEKEPYVKFVLCVDGLAFAGK
ncbi:hypothetical protein INR49_031772 [Caranx melampygus]|nr:hypothetical protein INR49_031772 [Caranx melampygus]